MVRVPVWSIAAVVLVLAPSRPATARDRCATPWLVGPVVDPAAGLTVVRSDSMLECSGPRRRQSCRLRESFEVRSRSSAPVHAAIHHDPRLPIAVRVDGARPTVATPPVLEGRAREELDLVREDHGATLGFEIAFVHGDTARIVVETRVAYDADCRRGAVAIERRHPLVSRDVAASIDVASWGPIGMVYAPDASYVQRLTVPRHWWLYAPTPRTRDRDAGRGQWIGTTRGHFRTARRPKLAWGGPIVAVGVARRSGAAEPKLRAGWELGILRRFIATVAVESDARRHLEVVPSAELTPARRWPPEWWLIPMPSLGIGVPVELVPRTRVGIRGQLGLHWPWLALVGFVDGHPRWGDAPRRVTGGAMLQIGI